MKYRVLADEFIQQRFQIQRETIIENELEKDDLLDVIRWELSLHCDAPLIHAIYNGISIQEIKEDVIV